MRTTKSVELKVLYAGKPQARNQLHRNLPCQGSGIHAMSDLLELAHIHLVVQLALREPRKFFFFFFPLRYSKDKKTRSVRVHTGVIKSAGATL